MGDASTITITLAGQEYRARKLTVRQSISLECDRFDLIAKGGSLSGTEALAATDPDAAKKQFLHYQSFNVAVVAAALSRENPNISVDAVLDMEASLNDLADAALKILIFSEAVRVISTGEAKAPEELAAPTGA